MGAHRVTVLLEYRLAGSFEKLTTWCPHDTKTHCSTNPQLLQSLPARWELMRAECECWQLPRWSRRLNNDIHQALIRLMTMNVGFSFFFFFFVCQSLARCVVLSMLGAFWSTATLNLFARPRTAKLVLLRKVLEVRWSTSAELRTQRRQFGFILELLLESCGHESHNMCVYTTMTYSSWRDVLETMGLLLSLICFWFM